MAHRVQLLIIDPQNDFCDVPTAWQPIHPLTGKPIAPALPVAGAHADMQRLAAFITSQAGAIDAITITLDSHQRHDIAHPDFWQTGAGADVVPFTSITAAQVRAEMYHPRNEGSLPYVLAYLDALEEQNRYTHMVWPVHCEIGSWGHGIHASVAAACGAWQIQHQQAVAHVFKGMNPMTENYSALQAQVPDPTDPDTQLHTRLLAALDTADTLFIAGEASSHCVRATVEHLVQYLPSQRPERIVLLTDCMSPVTGFEAQHTAFLATMQSCGVQLAVSDRI